MSFSPQNTTAEFVYIPVPVGRVEEVFRLLASLSGGSEESVPDMEKVVRRIFLESEERFRSLLRFLAGHPGQPISTTDTAEALGLPNGVASLAGMLGAFARRSKNRYDGFWPFERLYNPAQDRAELMMEDNLAAIVNGLDLPS
jgi:hypothetical protein